MTRVRLTVLVAAAGLLVSGCGAATRTPSSVPPTPSGWRRVLLDNFRGHHLNGRIWTPYTGQPGGDPGGWWDPSHVVVRNGVLHLETFRDRRFGNRWVSGGVSSAHGLQQRYGKYLVRFRMAGGKGVAGILLLWPQAPHWPPEIDFAETGGEHTNRPDISATVHYPPGDQTIERTIKENFTKWHVVGVEWTPSRLVYTLDGRRWASVRSPHVPAEPMELDMQAQAGTCGVTYAPCPDTSTPSHVDLDVDWVVAYGRTA